MKPWRNIRKIAVGLVLLLILTACGAGGDSGAQKELKLIKNADIMSLDSTKATDEMSFEVLGAVAEGLYVLDENGMEKEALVEKVEESEDGLTYKFTLRDAKWSNGDPVTADDFVYAWQRLVDPENASNYAFIAATAGIKNAQALAEGEIKDLNELGVKALDEKNLEVVLDKRVPFFKKILTFGSFLPQNRKFVEEQKDQYAQSPDKLLYNGPFKMVEWVSGNSFKVVKNEDYWDKDQVKLDAISWKVAKDSQAAALEFDTGAADFVRLNGDIIENYKDDKRLQTDLGGYMWFLQVNTQVEDLKNAKLTKAIANGFDRQELADLVLKDGAKGAGYFVPEKLAVSPAGKDFREENGYDFFKEGPDQAKAYGQEAFKELKKDKLDLELLFEDTEESKKVAEFIQAQLEKNIDGLTINLKSQPKKARIQLQNDGDYQLALHRWGPDYPDPQTYLEMYLKDSANNYGKYDNEAYDQMILEAIGGGLSDEDRWTKLLEAEKLLLEEGQGPIPVYQTGNSVMWAEGVSGWIYNTTGVSYYYKYVDKE